MKPLVSFIIPTYNRAYILPKAMESIFAQTLPDWQLIIVDDGSTDQTKELVKDRKDSRITYMYQENAGPSAARNTGFSSVASPWVAYIDSDNTLNPRYIELMLATIKTKPDTLYALPMGKRIIQLYENGKLLKSIDDSDDFPKSLTVQQVFHRTMHLDVNGLMHSKILIDEGFRWDEDLNRMEDWDFFMTIANVYPDRFLYVPEVLSNYWQRFGGDGLVSNTTYRGWAEAFEYIYAKHKHDSLLVGQKWYPRKVEEYLDLQTKFEAGLTVSPQVRYFQ